jgi:hypothetical protein
MISPHICYTSVNAAPNNVHKLGVCAVYSTSVASWFLRHKGNSAAYLTILRSLAHDPQGVLDCCLSAWTVGIKLRRNIGILELSIAALTDADGRRGLLYDPQLALGIFKV